MNWATNKFRIFSGETSWKEDTRNRGGHQTVQLSRFAHITM